MEWTMPEYIITDIANKATFICDETQQNLG